MKLAIAKIGATITFSANNSSAANADILYFLRQLEIDNHDITIITHKTRNTKIPKRIKFLEVAKTPNIEEFDALLVFNGSINFFGGACDPNLLALYNMMRCSTIPIVYVNTDGQLYFKQLWPSIWKRDWAQNLHQNDYWVDPTRVSYLTQASDKARLEKFIDSKDDAIKPDSIRHYPIARTILAKHEKFIPKNETPYHLKTYDLGFGGATRNTYKRKRIEHYYNHPNTLLFGNLRGVTAPLAKMQAKCSYQHFIRMMMMCKSTVIVGDEFYEDNHCTLRFYESLLADCVTYIDRRMDPHFHWYGGMRDFHITNPEEIYIDTLEYNAFREYKNFVLDSYEEESEREELETVIKLCADLI